MNMTRYLAEKRKTIEKALDSYLPPASRKPTTIHQAMRYSIFGGGKRIRPILTLASAEAVGGESEVALPIACAIELIHTYSLIHDDLPAMDNDDLRRGKPTAHKAFGEAVAILVGDALLTEAFRLIATKNFRAKIKAGTVLKIIGEIATACGSSGMVGGQVVDIESTGLKLKPAKLEYLHLHKTADLIRVSVTSGGRVGGGTSQHLSALSTYGRTVGLAFQITDDIQDFDSKQDIGTTLGEKKASYPVVLGMSESKRRATELIDQAIYSLRGFDEKADPLRGIARYIRTRKQ
ncbi:MAG: polyprenyl synthetase family protein [Deltaproteobacteria bacterium]|nr:MAG: polyprenyl synthetase family protein [Deltaproteobacteria bacterium]